LNSSLEELFTPYHKGVPLLDIREYYGSGSDVKPGKKGISLKAVEVSLPADFSS
jgi:hypothetical protein